MADEIEVIGEVIESSTTEFVAESKELHSPAPFGSFVKVGMGEISSAPASGQPNVDDPFDSFRQSAGTFNSTYHGEVDADSCNTPPAIYAIIYGANTGPVDTGRKLRAYWKGETELEEINPELGEWLLVTNFRALVVGYCANNSVCRFLPPQPPKLLTPVYPCSPAEVRRLTDRMDFLRTIVNFAGAPVEELLAACIRNAMTQYPEDRRNDFVVSAGKELAALLRDDYDRLHAIIRRIAP